MSKTGNTMINWTNNDPVFFNKFIHDISCNITTSVKTLLDNHLHKLREDTDKLKDNKNKNKNKNKSKMKKKDIIIQTQNKKRNNKLISSDIDRISNFEYSNDKYYTNINYLKTPEGIIHYKYTLMTKLYTHKKEKINATILGLYYQLLNVPTLNMSFIKCKESITEKLEKSNYDMFQYMLSSLGNILPPLNFWDHNHKTLDKWQLKVLKNVKNNISTIVQAPTSSGKTFTAIGVSLFHKKVLYIVPTKPVAYQVASQFYKMKMSYNLLIDDTFPPNPSNLRIVIGTPEYVEKYLPVIGIKFNFAVFDEIHNFAKEDDGHMYENIIKLMKCNFLALSASIGNINHIKSTWKSIYPDRNIELVQYSKRFINLQRYIWNADNIKELHPLSCIDCSDLIEENDYVNKYNLPFTPNDTVKLYLKIEEEFEDLYVESDDDDDNDGDDDNDEKNLEDNVDNKDYKLFNVAEWKPYKFFENKGLDNKLISLDNCREYETFLKEKLVKLCEIYPDRVSKLLASFKPETSIISSRINKQSMYSIFRKLFDNKMGPAIVFNTDTDTCYKMFNDLYKVILEKEKQEYPYHYLILEFKQQIYATYRDKRNAFESKLKEDEKYTKLENFDEKERNSYITTVSDYYLKLLNKIKENLSIPKNIRDLQYGNLYEEYQNTLNRPDLSVKDIFKKHPKFCFSMTDPMSGNMIKAIRKEIKKSIGIEIDYESILFQMLKRGIGIYTENVPDIYKWIVQKLVSEKKLYFVISDRTLCLGIDLPFRSSVLMGYENSNDFTVNDFTQMSGRAGRRGLDDKGNIVFCGPINHNDLMKGKHLNIVSNAKKNTDLIPILKVISFKKKNVYIDSKSFTDDSLEKLYTTYFTDEKKIDGSEIKMNFHNSYSLDKQRPNILNIVWKLRYYGFELLNHFVCNLPILEKKIYMLSNQTTDRYLFKYLCEVFINNNPVKITMDNIHKEHVNSDNDLINKLSQTYSESRIVYGETENVYKPLVISGIVVIAKLCIDINNELYSDNKYISLCKQFNKIVNNIKHIMYNNMKIISNH